MKRKEFLQKGLATGALIGPSALLSATDSGKPGQIQETPWGYDVDYSEIRIERPLKGQPHRGKVLMAIQPHSDDIPLSAGGLIVEQAGGKVTNFSGNKWDYMSDNIIASNGLIHSEIQKTIKKI